MAEEAPGSGPLDDVLPAVTFECDLSGKALQLSPRWGELTGQPMSEALGSGWLTHFDSGGHATAVASFAEALNSSEPVHFVLRCRLRGDIWSWFRVAVRVRRRADRTPTVVGVAMPVNSDDMTDEGRVLVETHLLDFDRQLYGESIRVRFLRRLRGERKFPSLDDLREQIARDVARAGKYFRHEAVRRNLAFV